MHQICHYYYFYYDISHNPPKLIKTTGISPKEARKFITIKGIELYNNDNLRNETWMRKMFNHQKWQVLYELQWHYQNHPIIKNHITEYGYNALELLLHNHPKLAEIMHNYEYKVIENPKSGFIANPELADYFVSIKTYFNKLMINS